MKVNFYIKIVQKYKRKMKYKIYFNEMIFSLKTKNLHKMKQNLKMILGYRKINKVHYKLKIKPTVIMILVNKGLGVCKTKIFKSIIRSSKVIKGIY